MRQSRISAPGLKHLAFFEALATTRENSPEYRSATAGLLALRLVDHWVLAGASMVEPESVSVRSVREAIMAIPVNDPQREVLLGLINAMQTLRDVDLQPVLPRIFAFARTLEGRGALSLAADVYESAVRFGDEAFDGTLIIDSFMRLGYCRRMEGSLAAAEDAYMRACAIAKRRREMHRLYRAQIGLANVAVMRGNLPKADAMLQEVVDVSDKAGFRDVSALALHDHAVIARQRGDFDTAVCRAYRALQLSDSESHRERILGDIGACFVSMGRFDAARDALLIEEATAVSAQSRNLARINLLSVAARISDEQSFDLYRQKLRDAELAPEFEANFLIECARGYSMFGKSDEARSLLLAARAIAVQHQLNRVIHESDSMLVLSPHFVKDEHAPTVPSAAAVYVEAELRTMAAALQV